MKIIILLLISATLVHAETNLFRFSGNCVVIKNSDVPKGLSADEILNFPNAIKHPFPEFFFLDDGGTYGVTNWCRLPNSPIMVGSEFSFQVDISRRVIDNTMYFLEAKYLFCFFDSWNERWEMPNVVREGCGFATIPLGKNFLFCGDKILGGRSFTIVRVDQIPIQIKK